jgi:hypothetical protein
MRSRYRTGLLGAKFQLSNASNRSVKGAHTGLEYNFDAILHSQITVLRFHVEANFGFYLAGDYGPTAARFLSLFFFKPSKTFNPRFYRDGIISAS